MSVSSTEVPLTTATSTSGELAGPLLPVKASVPVADVVPAPPKPKITRNRKPRPPKDSRIFKAVKATLALRAQGLKYDEIGEQLGLTKNTVVTYLKRAREKGWINIGFFTDPEDKLEIVLKSKVVDNLHAVLNETVSDDNPNAPSNRAFEASLEIAKGTGLLKQHQVVKSDSQSTVGFALKVQVEMPPAQHSSPIQIRPGSVGGTPTVNAEVIRGDE